MLDAGRSAGICYMKDAYDDIEAWPDDKALRLFYQTAESGHQSVDGHDSYKLLLTGVPKIIAMILNT